jgi:hypothetical protein
MEIRYEQWQKGLFGRRVWAQPEVQERKPAKLWYEPMGAQ